MENIIYNEHLVRDFSVDVGVVEYSYKDSEKKSTENSPFSEFTLNQTKKRGNFDSTLTKV